ncbi:tyrosine-type recombinase/integrase [Pseudorhodobacter ferrugineus]|uniref:tyrosine-type recombinase/integrase n=1 Tax=Pseudorhodobacter ferrugineus TaxID=77008 RepID=UPI00138ACDDD|nr:tyrosine-type recombinase/integrase [Pseudorhodobacter ferrugineus]
MERKGSYYYNRRVPQHAVDAFGPTVRIKLSQGRVEASELAKALSTKLDQAWSSGSLKRSVDVKALLEAVRPRPVLLSDWVTEYVELKGIDPTPPNVAVDTLVSIVGDKEALAFTREDARAFVAYLRTKGNSTGTVRRRVNSIAVVISYAQRELDVMQQNPFSRLHIQGEGKDRQKRLTFTVEELRQGTSLAIAGGSRLALLFPVLAETGCRLGEMVGLRLQDIDLEQELIRITPHSARSLKTSGSDRELPLVGAALVAM